MLLLAGLSISGVAAIFIVFCKYRQRQKNKRLRSNMEYRADQHKRDARRYKNLSLEIETNQKIKNAACASVEQDVLDSDDVLIGQIDNIMQSTKTQNGNSSLPILENERGICFV